jgi:hypothetical protein
MADDQESLHRNRRIGVLPPTAIGAAMIELFLADAEIERRSGRLAALAVRLHAERPTAGEPPGVRDDLDVAIGCLLDHLRPAREVVRRFRESTPATAWTAEFLRVARELATLDAADHRIFQGFLADLEGEPLAALRHLLDCPLCARMPRLLLLGGWTIPAPSSGGRNDRPGGPPRRRRKRRRPPAAGR